MDRRREHKTGRSSKSNTRYGVVVRRNAGFCELVVPKQVRERDEDLEEVRKMLDAGEVDIAVNELRWLLVDCHDFLEAHYLLGKIALEEQDLDLAGVHLEMAYRIGLDAMPSRRTVPLRHNRAANAVFFRAAMAYAQSLVKSGKPEEAKAVRDQLLQLDPTVPLPLT